MWGTREPTYPDPDAELQRHAAAWVAKIDPRRLREYVASLPGPRNRFDAPDAMATTERLMLDAWRAAGWRVGRQRVTLRSGVEGANLVAIGGGRSREAVVLVAHYDTVSGSPGADDNGAGLAILLELSERLDHHPFDRTVILAAPDFEEVGLIGSRHLVRWLRRHYRLVEVIVFDPIGYMSTQPSSQQIAPGIDRLYPDQFARVRTRSFAGDTVVSIYRGRSQTLVLHWARCLAATLGRDRVVLVRDPIDLPLLGPLLFLHPTARHFARSDHVNFWLAGLPAIQVTDTANFRNPHYHRPSDVVSTLDYETLARVTAATAAAVERLAHGRARQARQSMPASGGGRDGNG
ncbi:MAG: M28 family peptidase [Candidatus Limnocylindria bacterium]